MGRPLYQKKATTAPTRTSARREISSITEANHFLRRASCWGSELRSLRNRSAVKGFRPSPSRLMYVRQSQRTVWADRAAVPRVHGLTREVRQCPTERPVLRATANPNTTLPEKRFPII